MKRTFKLLSLLMALVLAVGTLSACFGKKPEETTPPPPAAKPTRRLYSRTSTWQTLLSTRTILPFTIPLVLK